MELKQCKMAMDRLKDSMDGKNQVFSNRSIILTDAYIGIASHIHKSDHRIQQDIDIAKDLVSLERLNTLASNTLIPHKIRLPLINYLEAIGDPSQDQSVQSHMHTTMLLVNPESGKLIYLDA